MKEESIPNAVLCRVGQAPELVTLDFAGEPAERLAEKLVKRNVPATYPRYLVRKGEHLLLLVDDNGMNNCPHNRWGIHGDFLVLSWQGNRKRPSTMTDAVARNVIRDLSIEYGPLDERSQSGVIYGQQIGIFCQSAPQFEQAGGTWNPDLHFTGLHAPPEIKIINWLLLRYAPHLEAMYVMAIPLPDGIGYSVELQFREGAESQRKRHECHDLYVSCFDDDGNQLPAIVARPPLPW